MLTDFPLASPLSSASLSSLSTSSSSTSPLPRTHNHQDPHSHSYSSYPSSPLASFFPSPPSISSFFFPDIEIELNSDGVGSKAGGGGARDESDAFGLGGFFERSVGGGDKGRGFGWVSGRDEEESENESDEGELEEQQGDQGGMGQRPGDGGKNGRNLWLVQTEDVHSPVIETTFGFDVLASEGEKDGRKGTDQGELGERDPVSLRVLASLFPLPR
jgi:hypothetical protein